MTTELSLQEVLELRAQISSAEKLSPDHAQVWATDYGTLDEDQFIELACNSTIALPERNLGGSPLHIPALWMGAPATPDEIISKVEYDRLEHDRKARAQGWKKLKYLIILPGPSSLEHADLVPMHPRTQGGRFLRKQLEHAGIDPQDVVVTYAARFALPEHMKNYAQAHFKSCRPYLMADIRECQPDVIIAIGAWALKALYGHQSKLDSVRGSVMYFEGVPVIPTVSHLAFFSGHANLSVFQGELSKAREIADRVYSVKKVETDYRMVDSVAGVRTLCDEIRLSGTKHISFDTEFGNDVAREEFTYTLSVQLCWAEGKAAFIKLRDQVEVEKPIPEVKTFWDWAKDNYKDPVMLFDENESSKVRAQKRYSNYVQREYDAVPWEKCVHYHMEHNGKYYLTGQKFLSEEDEATIWSELQQLMLDKRWRLDAHHLRVDAEQFHRNGVNIDDRIEDGFDTMLVHHALYGDEDQGLDHLVRKYAPHFGAFWQKLEDWLDSAGRGGHLRFGYRDIPLDVLVPYACKDADATYQLADILAKELDDRPTTKALYFNHIAATSQHLLDMERHGILIDEDKRQQLYGQYKPVYDQLLARLREHINWPNFNPGSDQQVQSLLFSSTVYKNKKVAPEGVRVLKLKPLFNTDKYPMRWEEIEPSKRKLHGPSIKATTIELMQHIYPDVVELRWLKSLSVIGKFLTTYLKPQSLNEFGVVEDGKGFHNNIDRFGRVHTRIGQLTQTGRYTSQKANLQTKPKKQEAAAFAAMVDFYFECSVKEYEKRCDTEYTGPDKIESADQLHIDTFASCFIPEPGYVFIEADFKTAELFIWAYCSGDKELIKVLDMGRDLHSEVACKSFQLPPGKDLPAVIAALEAGDPKPYKEWNAKFKAEYEPERIAAKAVNFGIMYGRGPGALAAAIGQQGVDMSREDCQKTIDGFGQNYPVAWEWICQNSIKAILEERIENVFGRCRYFQGARNMPSTRQAAIGREAKNAPIQGTVADLLAQAGNNLYRFLHKTQVGAKFDIRVLLPVHDAFLFEIPRDQVEAAKKVISMCMSTMNKIPGTDYYLQLDVEVMEQSWGDH